MSYVKYDKTRWQPSSNTTIRNSVGCQMSNIRDFSSTMTPSLVYRAPSNDMAENEGPCSLNGPASDSQVVTVKESSAGKRLIRIVVWATCCLGFFLQSSRYLQEYFYYSTSSKVHFVQRLPVQSPPSVAICSVIEGEISNFTISTLFRPNEPLNDTTELIQTSTNVQLQLKRFIRDRLYCFAVMSSAIHNESSFTYQKLYSFTLKTDYFSRSKSPILYQNKDKTMVPLLFLMARSSRDSNSNDFEGPHLTPPVVFSDTTLRILDISLSFSTKEQYLLPPPFDTNCRDYSMVGLSSSHNCLTKCFHTQSISQFNSLFSTFLIDKDEYGDQSVKLVLSTNKTFDSQRFPGIEAVTMSCRRRCANRDCIIQDIKPVVTSSFGDEKGKLEDISVAVYSPNEWTVRILFYPSMTLFEFVGHMADSLFFWLVVALINFWIFGLL